MANLEVHPLMRTIVDHPDADLPRLVYADWLDEQGDPKMTSLAEFIRLSIENQAGSTGSLQWSEVNRRLCEAHLSPKTPCPPIGGWDSWVLFDRGLPYLFSCTLKQFAEGGADVLECAPVTAVSLACPEGFMADAGDVRYAIPAFRRPEVHRIRDLAVRATLDGAALANLVDALNPEKLQSLTLNIQAVSAEAANSLTALAQFPHLRHIACSIGHIPKKARNVLRAALGERLQINGAPA